jgi:hypothetical protein
VKYRTWENKNKRPSCTGNYQPDPKRPSPRDG